MTRTSSRGIGLDDEGRVDDEIPFDIGVLLNLVSHLEREERESHTSVIRPCCEPVDVVSTGQHPLLGTLPEPDMMALGRAAGDLLLVREVLLLPVEQMQRAHWSLRIASAGEGGGDDLASAGQAEVVSARVHPAAVITVWTCPSSPRRATFTGSPSRPSLVLARPMGYPGT